MPTAAASRSRSRRRLDFGDALLHVLQNEYDDVLSEFLTDDVPEVAKGLVALPVAAAKGLWSAAMHVFEVGVMQAASDAYEGAASIAEAATELPGRATKAASFFYDEFVAQLEVRKDTADKALFVAKLTTYLGTFATGAVVGADTPDKDISALGIGSHRNFFFHSAAIALGVKLVCRLLLRIVSRAERLVKKNTPDHDALKFIATNLSAVSFGYALGTAAHLAKDAVIDGDQGIRGPWGGTLIPDATIDDDAYLLVNSFIAIMAGKKPMRNRQRLSKKKGSNKKKKKKAPTRTKRSA